MRQHQQFEYDSYRIILLQPNRAEVLLFLDDAFLSLPSFEVSQHRRTAETLTAAMQHDWHLNALCMFTLDIPPFASEARIHYQVMVSRGSNDNPLRGPRWVPVSSLTEKVFRDIVEYLAIQRSLEEIEAYGRGAKTGPFGYVGWLAEVMDWVQSKSSPLGLTLTGSLRQVNAGPKLSLIRFETDGSPLWFKAVGEPTLQELPMSLELARLFPRFVPNVIASRTDWNAWLAFEAVGTHLDRDSELSAWMKAATTLADLQIDSIGHTLHLLQTGSRDARVPSLLALVDPFFEAASELMGQQTKLSPAPLAKQEILALAIQVKQCLSDLAESEFPNVLGHLDFNPNNILVSEDCCVLLDWAEACVGLPFLTLHCLVEHLRRFHADDPSWESAVTSCYAKSWHSFIPSREFTAEFEMSRLVAVFAYAACTNDWQGRSVSRCPATAAYLRSLTRRMKREADSLSERRLPCIKL